MTDSTFSSENLNKAMELMRGYINNDSIYLNQSSPTLLISPQRICIEQKYWIPYGNVAVPVQEEVEYKFVYKLQGYLRNKWQDVSLPRFMEVL